MKAMANFAVRVLGIAAVVMGMVVFSSCTDEKEEAVQTRSPKASPVVTPDPERYATYDFSLTCDAKESSFAHTGTSEIAIFVKGSETPETSFKKSLKSNCSISLYPDTVRVSEGFNATQTNVSIDRGYKGNVEGDNVLITVSDSRVLELPYSAEHTSPERWMNIDYKHGHDSLVSARLIKVENDEVVKPLTRAAAATYVKNTYNTKYFVEVTTQAYAGDGRLISKDLDTLAVTGITLVLADNNASTSKTSTGVRILNETQQRDSMIVTKTWDDGHSETINLNTILNRWLKNIERREVITPNFDDATYATSFSRVEGGETLVRQDANWKIYGREVVVSKMVSVANHTEEVRYTYYQERAEVNYENLSHKFEYVDWNIENYADNFKTAAVSEKNGYDELDYTNEIKTNYLGFVQYSNEAIAWFKEAIKINGYGVINASRVDYTTYTKVSLEKVAYYSDGTEKTVGKYSAELPIVVKPLTNWVLNEDVWGVYTSGDLATTQVSKSSETEKFFAYNKYVYNFSNDVKGQLNKGMVSVPNDIVFNDGDVEYTFANSTLNVSKKNEGTSFVSENDEKSTYSYACVASVTFGDASQDCTLPGTINIAKAQRNHDHGKVVATYCTSTPDESRNSWYNVACIQFEDGYRMVGMTTNESMTFEFTMNSTKDVNSAVYADGRWMPAKAADESKCMKWKDENGVKKAVLDYISATAMAWNNGHNTVVDVRREGKISEDGYSVTFYLNGLAGQTLDF